MKIEYWNDRKLIRTEDWPDTNESFEKYYHLNNRLKYCNGSYYRFVSDEVRKRYEKEFFPKYHTIENYYNGGIVD